MYYVYHLIDPTTNLPFYVGKGKGNRAWSHLEKYDTHNNYKNNKIKLMRKNGIEPKVTIVLENVSAQEALAVEISEIEKYGRKDIDEGGILTNRTAGGLGGDTSMCFTEETRKRLRERSTGTNNPNCKLTEEQVIEIFLAEESTNILAKKYKVSPATVKDIKRKNYHKKLLENYGNPGLDPNSLRHRILPEETVRQIYDFDGTVRELKEKFKCNAQFARNIKFGRTYTHFTENYDHEPGEIKIHNLTWDDICEIRVSELSCDDLGRKFKVHKETIRNIKNGKTRKYS